jgi:hypothetical protein
MLRREQLPLQRVKLAQSPTHIHLGQIRRPGPRCELSADDNLRLLQECP